MDGKSRRQICVGYHSEVAHWLTCNESTANEEEKEKGE
jgi:hypothetical protein